MSRKAMMSSSSWITLTISSPPMMRQKTQVGFSFGFEATGPPGSSFVGVLRLARRGARGTPRVQIALDPNVCNALARRGTRHEIPPLQFEVSLPHREHADH